jgi:predicted PurR-regulated permease PerM
MIMSDEPASQTGSVPLENRIPLWEKPARYSAAFLLLIGIVLSLILVVPVLDMVALGFLIAFVMYLLVRGFARRVPTSYTVVLLLLYLAWIVLLVVLFVNLAGYLVEQIDQLFISLEEAMAGTEPSGDFPMDQLLGAAKDTAGWLLRIKNLFAAALGFVNRLVLFGTALLFSFFLLIDLNKGRGSLSDWVPLRYRREVTLLLMQLDHIWSGYLVAQFLYGMALAVASAVLYTLLGVPVPILLAILTGLISLIPSVGGLLASVVVAIPCLFLGSTRLVDMSNLTFTLLVTILNVLITQITYNFFAVPIVGKYVKLPVSVVFVGVLIGLSLGSIILAFLIVPILATLRAIGGYLLAKAMEREPFPDETLPEPPLAGFFSQVMMPSSASSADEE